jgi:uncharacterized SAM-binding protein YcdF (DUF218 family)
MKLWLRLRRLAIGICAAVGLAFLLATFSPFVPWYAARLARPWNDPTGDVLIVLAGADLDGGFPAQNTLLRCLYALRAHQAARFRAIVVSGQSSRHMRNLLAAEGVPPEIIRVEDASSSTRENALFTARLLAGDSGRKVLLTSDYHMFRAARAFRKAGLEVAPRPIPDVLKRWENPLGRWPAFLDEAIETGKTVVYFARGWI